MKTAPRIRSSRVWWIALAAELARDEIEALLNPPRDVAASFAPSIERITLAQKILG